MPTMSPQTVAASVTSAICLTLGILFLAFFGQFMRQQIDKRLSLCLDCGETLRIWRDVPAPFLLRVYLFHVENPGDIVSHGDKPRVSQLGPYTYREQRHKDSLRFYDNASVSFRERRDYHFLRGESYGDESDVITALNVPAMSAAMLADRLSPRLREVVSALLGALGERAAFRTLTVRQLLWGYGDPLTRALHTLSPALWPSPEFGLLVGFNNSDTGEFLVDTGIRDIHRVHNVLAWNGLTELSYWQSEYCNRISGTAGEMWPPLFNQSLPLTFFSPDTCRTIDLRSSPADQQVEQRGLALWRFSLPPSLFDNGTKFPANRGFGPALGTGVMNLSACRHGAPVFVSQPHFFQADPVFVSDVSGLEPDEGRHQSFIDVHPETGVPINVSIRLQINLYIRSVPEIRLTGIINPVLLPLMWFSESGHMAGPQLEEFWRQMVLLPMVVKVVSALLVVIGGSLAVWVMLTAAHRYRRHRRRASSPDGGTGASETSALLGS